MIRLLLPLTMVLSQARPMVVPGERLAYEVSSARFGRIGTAEFNTILMGDTIRLTFDSKAKILLFKASDHTESDLDAESLRTVRYSKRERSPIGKRDENVVVDHSANVWTDGDKQHALASADALDELSFIYLVRSLELSDNESVTVRRHFDEARNPIVIRNINNESGTFINGTPVDIVEMNVPDKRQDGGRSIVRFYISRDEKRVPLRIESSMPVAGRVTMTLKP